jgi:hypothetical protein
MSDSILNLRAVKREASKVVIGLAGTTGTGKTYSALQLAYGLAGKDASKVGLLDTENRRGELYADIFPKPFIIGDLTPPFSPSRYISALRQFSESGIEVLVVDSTSHCWEGEGGCEELANNPNKRMADWLTAKREHKRFVNTLLMLPAHVICCFRAREKMDFRNPKEPVSLGVQPICEKNLMYEMSASFLLQNAGKSRQVIKLPECLIPILGGDGYLTPAHGERLREWIGGSDPLDRAKNVLRLAASEGTETMKKAWGNLSPSEKKGLESFKDTLKDLAAHADSERPKNAPLSEEDKAELSRLEEQGLL